MAIGSFMGVAFTVSDKKVLTPKGLKGSTGGDWAVHDRIGLKSRSQFLGPKLRSYSFELLLRAQDGVDPRGTLRHFQQMAESGAVDWFVIGGTPLSTNPFRLVGVSDTWDTVIAGGTLVECRVSLEIEEYL